LAGTLTWHCANVCGLLADVEYIGWKCRVQRTRQTCRSNVTMVMGDIARTGSVCFFSFAYCTEYYETLRSRRRSNLAQKCVFFGWPAEYRTWRDILVSEACRW
jgi:hypothetical protein